MTRRYEIEKGCTVEHQAEHIGVGTVLEIRETPDGLPGVIVRWKNTGETQLLAQGYVRKVGAETAL